ncbi:hypothetical protein SAMN02927900_01162 [Rhizobium mongolense subsp. loessense]|uniref:Uncharacterized protein n=1 Tax=Rhizobium mongolense subsp. loessense TaxID=158890 RepID=A0A1G4Q0F2_9HYPH|nr:hypothetical protein SAMN02927900_01162 [Rhizobium mongolense subsp. loessense]
MVFGFAFSHAAGAAPARREKRRLAANRFMGEFFPLRFPCYSSNLLNTRLVPLVKLAFFNR